MIFSTLFLALVLHQSSAIPSQHVDKALDSSPAKENDSSSFQNTNRTVVKPQLNIENSDRDGDSSKKIIGSSVVTSVSVILNGNEPEYADAMGKKVPKPQPHLQVASPINLLNPDRYEFYTFDDHGDLVKRLMTMKEIQSIVANGDGEGPTIIHPAPIEERDPEKNVQDIVNSVQNVLNREVESSKNTSVNDSISSSPPLDTPDVSSSWSMILPAIFGNTGGEIFPPNKQQQIAMTPDSEIVEQSTKPSVKPTSKPQKKHKPGNKRKTTTTTTPKPSEEEDVYQSIQEELGPNESVYAGLQQYQNIAAANGQNLEAFSSSFHNLHKISDSLGNKNKQKTPIEKDDKNSTKKFESNSEIDIDNRKTSTINSSTAKYKQKIKTGSNTKTTESPELTSTTVKVGNKRKKPTRHSGGQKRKPGQSTQKIRLTTSAPQIDEKVIEKINNNNNSKVEDKLNTSTTQKPLTTEITSNTKMNDTRPQNESDNHSEKETTEKFQINMINNNLSVKSSNTGASISLGQNTPVAGEPLIKRPILSSQQQQQQHPNRYPVPQLNNRDSPEMSKLNEKLNHTVQNEQQLPPSMSMTQQEQVEEDEYNTKISFDQIMESLKESNSTSDEHENGNETKTSAMPQPTAPMLYGGVDSLEKLEMLSANKKIFASSTQIQDQWSSTTQSHPVTVDTTKPSEDQQRPTTLEQFPVVETEPNAKITDSENIVLITQRPLNLSTKITTTSPLLFTNTEITDSRNVIVTTIGSVVSEDEPSTINDHQVLKFEPLYADIQEPIVTYITTTTTESPIMTTFSPEVDITEQLQLSKSEENTEDINLITSTLQSIDKASTHLPQEIDGDARQDEKKIFILPNDAQKEDIITHLSTATTEEPPYTIYTTESVDELNEQKDDEIEVLMSQVFSQITGNDDYSSPQPSMNIAPLSLQENVANSQNQETANRLSNFAQINPSFQINASTSLASSSLLSASSDANDDTKKYLNLPQVTEPETTTQDAELEDTNLNYQTISSNENIKMDFEANKSANDTNAKEEIITPAVADIISGTSTEQHPSSDNDFSMTTNEPDIEQDTDFVDKKNLFTSPKTIVKDDKDKFIESTTIQTPLKSTTDVKFYSSQQKPNESVDQITQRIISFDNQDSHKQQVEEDSYIKLGEISSKPRVPLISNKKIQSELIEQNENNKTFSSTNLQSASTENYSLLSAIPKATTTATSTTPTAKSTTATTKKSMNTLKPVSYYKQPSFSSSYEKYPLFQNFNWQEQQQQQQQRPVVRPASLSNLKVTSQSPKRPPVKLDPSPSDSKGLEASINGLDEDLQDFSRLCNELAFTYWKTITSEKISPARSLIMSPFALTSMLAMVFLGARGGTSGEMNEVLRLDDMVTFNPHQVFKNITESVEKATDSNIATAAFVREIFSDRSNGKILQFFKEKTQQFYGGYVEEVIFHKGNDVIRRRTNQLVKRHTMNKVPEYWRTNSEWVNGPLATISANLFETNCSDGSTNERDGEMFFQVHPSVRQRRLVPIPAVLYKTGFMAGYEPTLNASIVAFGRIHDSVSTIFVMPGHPNKPNTIEPTESLHRLEKDLIDTAFSKQSWSNLLTSLMYRPDLEVHLPRFSHRSFINASLGLQKMGLEGLFKSDFADLRGLTGSSSRDIFLSDMIQINTFSTCGEEKISENHHTEIYPAPPIRKRNKDVDVDENGNDAEGIIDSESLSHETVGREFFDDHLLDPKFLELPLPLRPRQARIPDAPRLRFDKPFLYFVRHNPTGVILFMGRFNPRMQP